MRERAAAFLWEMDRQNYNRALLEDVTADERQSLFGAASNGFKFQSQMAAVWGTNFSPQERSIRKAYLDFMKLQP